MAPVSANILFHKKTKPQPSESPSPKKPKPATPRPRPKQEEDDDLSKLPEGPFQEFRLMSSALNGWKYDVMKFDSRKPVDISTWQAPIKLNRKEPRRDDAAEPFAPEAVAPMVGADGKPVIGADGRIVMVDADGRPIHTNQDVGMSKDAKGKGTANGKKKFQKKTRQVFLVPEATRQLRKEERYPWVIEDTSQKEVWVGKLEDISRSETHAFFMPAAQDVFKFVPAHRWYKFQKRPNYHIPNLEEAESILAKLQKNKDPERWLLYNRNGKAPSAATSALFKAEAEGRVITGEGSLVHTSSQSFGPGGRRLKAVDSGSGLFGDDEDEEGGRRKKEKELGGEGDLDEQEYEADFADDDDKVEEDGEDEEAKELEERLKREYKNANKTREGFVDESEEEEEEDKLGRDGKAIKKLIRSLEKNNAYDSDEDKNPYASSEEEEEEEEPPVATGPAIQPQQTAAQAAEPAGKSSQPPTPAPTGSASRATSPTPNLGGHSVVAKRATSPKAPKLKTNGISRGNSPLAGVPSRATSPSNGVGSRGGSPGANNPITSGKVNNKRKATDDLTSSSAGPTNPKTKKRKAVASPAGELEDRMVIEWLRNAPNASTRDCIQHFTPYLTDEAKKSKFTALVKEVAQLKGGVLVLRNAYRNSGSTAPSPAAGV